MLRELVLLIAFGTCSAFQPVILGRVGPQRAVLHMQEDGSTPTPVADTTGEESAPDMRPLAERGIGKPDMSFSGRLTDDKIGGPTPTPVFFIACALLGAGGLFFDNQDVAHGIRF